MRNQLIVNRNHVNLSFTQNISLSNVPYPHQITHLVLSHCQLHTLQGLQQFDNLQSLNLRHNNITDIRQLSRIKNKHLLQQLDITGNEVQYCRDALFSNLVKVFINLKELNGKNYQFVINKKMKMISLAKIVGNVQRIQKELIKTLRKSKRNSRGARVNDIQKEMVEVETKRNQSLESAKCKRFNDYQDDFERKTITDWQQSIIVKHQLDKQNLFEGSNRSYLLDNDHSLGNLSQVPMTKSVRRSIASQSHHQQQQQQQPTPALNTKRNALEIVTLNESDQNRVMLQPQPTATFANQRQKQNAGTKQFIFKNTQKTDRRGRMSQQLLGQEWMNDSECEQGLLTASQVNVRDQKSALGQASYLRSLVSRCFYQLKYESMRKRGIPQPHGDY